MALPGSISTTRLVDVPGLVDLVDLQESVGLEDLLDHAVEPT